VLLLSWHDSGNVSYGMIGLLPFAVILFLLWLAWKDLQKIPWWNWLIMCGIFIFCMIRPGAWLIGIPLIGYILFASRKK